MKKINVVKDSEEFNKIISSKVCVKDKNLIIYYKKNNLGRYRFGITVPKKLGKAHIRNYYKRVLRNICDINNFCYSKDKDYIIIVRKGCLETTYQEIEKSFKYLMSKVEKEYIMKNKKIILLCLIMLLLTGCTTYLKDEDKKNVTNPHTGQNLTENILCRPTDSETIRIYEEYEIDLEKLPYCVCESDTYTSSSYTNGEYTENEYECEEFGITTGGYEGLWTNIFVKPLAWVIIFIGKHLNNFGVGLILTSLLIRLIAYPFTNKTAMQSELIKKAQPELDRLEKKYANKDLNDQNVMMMKSQEMMAIYKKYNINPLSGCLFSFIQLPLFIAFLEAINRVPAIFEETFLGLHLGTSPIVGIQNGNWWYVIIIALVGITTYFSFKLNSKDMPAANGNDVKKQTNMMMNVFIIMIDVMSVFMTSALGIYWITTNLFTVFQNLVVKRRIKK